MATFLEVLEFRENDVLGENKRRAGEEAWKGAWEKNKVVGIMNYQAGRTISVEVVETHIST